MKLKKPDYQGFAAELMKDFWWDTGDVDAWYIDQLALKYGLIYTVDLPGSCGKDCGCDEYYGDDQPRTCHRFVPELLERRNKILEEGEK